MSAVNAVEMVFLKATVIVMEEKLIVTDNVVVIRNLMNAIFVVV